MSFQDLRDLQSARRLAWFDEELLAKDEELRADRRGRKFTLRDQDRMSANSASSRPCCRYIANSPRAARSRSPPRRSTIRFCRCCAIPISPQSRIPACTLPPRFRYPQDALRPTGARAHLHARHFGSDASGSVAFRRLGIGRSAGHGRRLRLYVGRQRQRSAVADAGQASRAAKRPIRPYVGSRAAARCACCFAIIISAT